MGLLKIACLILLSGEWVDPGIFPLPFRNAGSDRSTHRSCNYSRASSLQCSNDLFTAEGFGEVVVSQSVHVTQGMSLNIAEASSGASADGKRATQMLFLSMVHPPCISWTWCWRTVTGLSVGLSTPRDKLLFFLVENGVRGAKAASYGGESFANVSNTLFWQGEEALFSRTLTLTWVRDHDAKFAR